MQWALSLTGNLQSAWRFSTRLSLGPSLGKGPLASMRALRTSRGPVSHPGLGPLLSPGFGTKYKVCKWSLSLPGDLQSAWWCSFSLSLGPSEGQGPLVSMRALRPSRGPGQSAWPGALTQSWFRNQKSADGPSVYLVTFSLSGGTQSASVWGHQ